MISMERIEKNQIFELRDEFGTPFYLMFPARFRQNLRAFMQAFKKKYERMVLGYSFKTNYVPALCEIAKNEGCYAEVVSEMELELANRLGFNNIIFNGPIKKEYVIEKAIKCNAILNLDAEYEVDYICKFKKEHPDSVLSIGLRLNVHIQDDKGNSTIQCGLKHGRFGFPHDMLSRIIKKLHSAGIQICSLHGHSSSTDRAVSNFEIITKYMLSVREEFQLNDVKYFDIGGGFIGAAPDGMDLKGRPSYEDYSRAVLDIVCEDHWFNDVKPYIVIEPGASVVSNVFDYYTTVYQLKTIGTKRFAIVDGSVFDVKPTLHQNNLPFSVLSLSRETDVKKEDFELFDVVGSTCMEKDIILSNVNLDNINNGDILQIRGVGAYTMSLTPTFINFLSPVFSVENKNFKLVRKRQVIEDVLNIYKL